MCLINILFSPSLPNFGYFFASNRRLLKHLFAASSQAVLDWSQAGHFMPGIVTVLHTFGSKLNFNCHIHMLITLGGVDYRTCKFKFINFIAAKAIKSRFKTILLSRLRREFVNDSPTIPDYVKNEWEREFGSSDFFVVQNKLWDKDWYLYVGEKLDNVDFTVKYIGRYAKRPCLSEAKITYYSKREDIVKFSYHDKITNEDKIISYSIDAFLGLLFRHIPEKHFHMIRYSGIYANARKRKVFKLICDQINALFGLANLLFEAAKSKSKSWRIRILEATGVDPLKCKNCGITMSLTEIHYRIRDGTMKTVVFP